MTDRHDWFPAFAENGGLLPAIAQDAHTGEVLMLSMDERRQPAADARVGTSHVLQSLASTAVDER